MIGDLISRFRKRIENIHRPEFEKNQRYEEIDLDKNITSVGGMLVKTVKRSLQPKPKSHELKTLMSGCKNEIGYELIHIYIQV